MTASINVLRLAELFPRPRAPSFSSAPNPIWGPYLEKVKPIIEAVRTEGDEALARFARDFDKAPVDAKRIAASEEDFERAHKELEPEVLEAITYAAGNIRKFHEDQKPEEMWFHEIRPGVFAGDRINAIPSVACYIPRGKGAFRAR